MIKILILSIVQIKTKVHGYVVHKWDSITPNLKVEYSQGILCNIR